MMGNGISHAAATSKRHAIIGESASLADLGETVALRALLVAALALSFFASSGPIQWMDNGWFMLKASQGVYFNDRLDATYHPLYQLIMVVLYKLFGPYAIAYLNSFLMLPIAYVAYRLSRTIGLDQRYATLAALAVVLLQNVFWVSTKIEVYALHLLIVLTTYWLIFDEELAMRPRVKIFLIGLLTGLGAATHQLTFVVLFPLYIFLWQQIGVKRMLLALPGFALGAFSCYPAMLNDVQSGTSMVSVLRLFMTGSDGSSPEGWEWALLRFDKMWAGKTYVALVLISLCGIGLMGVIPPSTGPKHRTLWWAATLDLLFSVSFGVNDRFTFFLPGAAFYALLGVGRIFQSYGARPFACYAALAFVLAHPLILVGTALLADSGIIPRPAHVAQLPYRDDIRYFLSPYLPDGSAAAFVQAYEQSLPEGSVVLSDFSPLGALQAAQVTGHFLNRRLINCEHERIGWPHTMYLVRTTYCEKFINDYRVERAPLGYVISK